MGRSLRGTVYSSNCVFQQRIRKGTAGSPLAPSYPRRAQEPTPLPEARLHQKPTLRGDGVKSSHGAWTNRDRLGVELSQRVAQRQHPGWLATTFGAIPFAEWRTTIRFSDQTALRGDES